MLTLLRCVACCPAGQAVGFPSSVCMCEPMAKTDQPTTIKKYANRRLYNTGTST
ncbi:MAG TPA: polyhydroxyalkanoate synthesis regulator DNA-binding domain-containing protein, partial [Xanthobacteraceae bacterium]|nr:polyhydroxyalkanoate synthesis regulator DNA-binding domain-containing protein [Xanthobacteraceae bacterium]